MRSSISLFVVASFVGLFGLVACSSSSSSSPTDEPGGCAADPFSCPAGTTCAVKDNTGALDCLPSGAGTKGTACQNTAGQTTCGDELTCLQLSAAGGQCTPFCDSKSAAGSEHGCPAGELCTGAKLADTGTTFYVCVGGSAPADAGADAHD